MFFYCWNRYLSFIVAHINNANVKLIIMKGEKLKVVVLTNKDRKLLENINKSLQDIRRGRVKPFLADELRKHH